jgi:hypothetical protein
MPATTVQKLLRAASERIGPEVLAERLKVPRHLLEAWVSGHASVPPGKVMLLADLLAAIGGDHKH